MQNYDNQRKIRQYFMKLHIKIKTVKGTSLSYDLFFQSMIKFSSDRSY